MGGKREKKLTRSKIDTVANNRIAYFQLLWCPGSGSLACQWGVEADMSYYHGLCLIISVSPRWDLFIIVLRKLWNISHTKSLHGFYYHTLGLFQETETIESHFWGETVLSLVPPSWCSPLGKLCYRSLRLEWSLKVPSFLSPSIPTWHSRREETISKSWDTK